MRNINITRSCYVNSVGIGNIAVIIYDEILKEPKKYYENPDEVLPYLEALSNFGNTIDFQLETLKKLLKLLK